MSWTDVGERLDRLVGSRVEKLLVSSDNEAIVFVTSNGDLGFYAEGD